MIYGLFVFNYMRSIIIGLLFLAIIALRTNIFKRQKAGQIAFAAGLCDSFKVHSS